MNIQSFFYVAVIPDVWKRPQFSYLACIKSQDGKHPFIKEGLDNYLIPQKSLKVVKIQGFMLFHSLLDPKE